MANGRRAEKRANAICSESESESNVHKNKQLRTINNAQESFRVAVGCVHAVGAGRLCGGERERELASLVRILWLLRRHRTIGHRSRRSTSSHSLYRREQRANSAVGEALARRDFGLLRLSLSWVSLTDQCHLVWLLDSSTMALFVADRHACDRSRRAATWRWCRCFTHASTTSSRDAPAPTPTAKK